jgi:hypothetical protein
MRRAGGSTAALTLLVLTCLLPLVWPGDVPFINDEPQLVAMAVQANAARRLATMGLLGTYGFTYGPAPTWAYQALMAMSHDLVLVAALHALLMTVVTALALWWLARSMRLWIWFVPVPLLSPYFWFYARVLWDNTFLLPLGALALAGYAAHLERNSSAGLRIAVASMLLIPLVHLMGVALIMPLGAHMLLVRWRALWAHKASIMAMAALVLWLAFPYWHYLASPRPPSPGAGRVIDGWLFPLTGGRLLSADGLDYFYGPGPVSGSLVSATASVSALAYLLVWCGLALGVVLVARAALARTWTTRAHITAVAIGAILCQSAIDGISGRFQHPHYHNGTWIAFVLLSWMAIDLAAARRGVWRWSAVAATAVLSAALTAAVGGLAIGLHRSGGTRDVYGPTLANQQAIGRRLADLAPASDVRIEVSMWERFPHTPAILRALRRPRRLDLPRRDVVVRYADEDPASGVIELVER